MSIELTTPIARPAIAKYRIERIVIGPEDKVVTFHFQAVDVNGSDVGPLASIGVEGPDFDTFYSAKDGGSVFDRAHSAAITALKVAASVK